ncbi:hypothetical protein BJ875DRAFT_490138 [Amylocarpus encephaloides]|uniref:EthD domain-containing protein n=1 Tax=Amylocarpus encephaloides TaxID=45428 RepID=A0A9P7Y6M0_9HELO|nr:hypothetical protein BJ875DRAFT_490138 [Amylocarpus encephaloides]
MGAQGLLIRNPKLTPEEFSKHWYNRHALVIVPFFLYCGVKNYVQIHAPVKTTQDDLDLASYDGAAETELTPLLLAAITDPSSLPTWVVDYYKEVILADEREFLVSEAMKHIKQVEEGTVTGERKAIIEDGKVVIEVPEGVWETWRGYETKGGEVK